MDAEEGVVRVNENCNSCIYFDPLKGFCKVKKQDVNPHDKPCEKWKYWDDEERKE